MYPLQIICLILDKKKAKAISNCGFSLAYIVDTKFIHNDIDSCGVKMRQHLGRWSWWREGDVVEGSLIGGGVRGGGAQKSRTSASSASRPSLAATPLRWPSANTLSTSRASFSGEHLLCKPAAASWCVTSFYSSSSSFDICVARIIVVASRTA